MEILSEPGAPSDKFQALVKRIRQDKRCAGVQIGMRRSTMLYSLAMLLNDSVIQPEDDKDFSGNVKDALTIIHRL